MKIVCCRLNIVEVQSNNSTTIVVISQCQVALLQLYTMNGRETCLLSFD